MNYEGGIATVHKRRLLRAARLMRAEAKRRKRLGRRRKKNDVFAMRAFVTACGTPGCVLGTYALRTRAFGKAHVDKIGDGGPLWVFTELRMNSRGQLDYTAPAVSEHFGLTYGECVALFCSTGCAGAQTEEQAAEYIEAFVARKEAEARK